MTVTSCTNCGIEKPPETAFCSSCGTPAAATGAPPPSNGAAFTQPSVAGAPVVRGLNSYAIASLVLSLVQFCGIGSALGIVFGNRALEEIRQTREDGEGLAKAGIVIGWVTLAVWVLSVPLSLIMSRPIWSYFGILDSLLR